MSKCDKNCRPTSIGGQAVIEGVMMQGPKKRATAVRKASGEIVIREDENKSFIAKYKLNKIPILRGFLAFFQSLKFPVAQGIEVKSICQSVAQAPRCLVPIRGDLTAVFGLFLVQIKQF